MTGTTLQHFFQAEHLTSCYWGGSSNALDRHDPSLPYLEQYRIDFEQFKGMFVLLFPWACGAHSDVLASRLFQLLDENGDSLINFREFVSGLSKDAIFLHELGGDKGVSPGVPLDSTQGLHTGSRGRRETYKACMLVVRLCLASRLY